MVALTEQEAVAIAATIDPNAGGFFRNCLVLAVKAGALKAIEASALGVRAACTVCKGTGHADADTECEYCGRPMQAIRALASEGK